MADDAKMQRLCEGYIRRVLPIGALYAVVPTALCFAGLFALAPFRAVYLLRLALALVAGALAGALVNRYGLDLWLLKHRSARGPATVGDGALIGAAVGFGTELLPPLTTLLASNHLETAKTFIIAAWLAATVLGALIGAVLATLGRRHLARESPATAGAAAAAATVGEERGR